MKKDNNSHEEHQWTDAQAEGFVKSMEGKIKSKYEPFAAIIAKLYKEYGFSDNLRILDLACGPGFLLIEILNKLPLASLVGIDSSEIILKYARQKIVEYDSPGIKFKRGIAEAIPLEDNSCSIITCLNSFHDFENPKKVLNEVYRVLEKNGIFILKDKDPNNPSTTPLKMEKLMKDMNFKANFISKKDDYILVGQK